MTLSNHRRHTERRGSSRSVQFYEFTCQACDARWSTPAREYKAGFLIGGLVGVTHWVHLSVPGIGWLQKAMHAGQERFAAGVEREAMSLGEARYRECPGCHRTVCPSCQDGQTCSACSGHAGASEGAMSAAGEARHGPRCPACNTASDGGRFCPECGFDLAATYKSCPSCAAQLPRAANFCPDCGHSF